AKQAVIRRSRRRSVSSRPSTRGRWRRRGGACSARRRSPRCSAASVRAVGRLLATTRAALGGVALLAVTAGAGDAPVPLGPCGPIARLYDSVELPGARLPGLGGA